MSNRNEGFAAINRLTGAFLDDDASLRTLVGRVKKGWRAGMFVDVYYHANGGGRTLVQRFEIPKKGGK